MVVAVNWRCWFVNYPARGSTNRTKLVPVRFVFQLGGSQPGGQVNNGTEPHANGVYVLIGL